MKKKQFLQNQASKGNSVSQNQLGRMYFYGEPENGVHQSYKIGLRWLHCAAAKGNDDAYYKLGWMYMFGEGVSPDNKLAVKFFKQAAVRGNTLGMEQVGHYYFEEKDYKKAAIWFKRALDTEWRTPTPLEKKTDDMKSFEIEQARQRLNVAA